MNKSKIVATVGFLVLVLSLSQIVFALMPEKAQADVANMQRLNLLRYRGGLDITVIVINPGLDDFRVVTNAGADLNGQKVAVGSRVYFGGRVIDRSTGQGAGGINVHVDAYQGIRSSVVQPGSVYTGGFYGTHVTDASGYYGSARSDYWHYIEFRSDGVYNPSGTKIISVALGTSDITFSFWAYVGNCGSNANNCSPYKTVIAQGAPAFTPVATVTINDISVVTDATYKFVSPLTFKVTYTTGGDLVTATKVWWSGTDNQALTKSGNDWSGTVNLATGTYMVRVVAYGSTGQEKTVLSFLWSDGTVNPPTTDWRWVYGIIGSFIGLGMIAYSRKLD